ncbi:MAG: hypothetical protein PQJ61_01865 [Spirochaetales bacterium]|uniref:Uncharacterized protein n=1 Tax=Candidatus Thalassospirochaeta sargassi TaxID=3119039 RepID=A0AAJ1ID02_9SPIO|nr:hypothetical protein [Spirochaetales bacterium]
MPDVKKQLAIIIFLSLLAEFAVLAETIPGKQDYRYQWPVSIFPVEQPYGNVKNIIETAYTMADDNGNREFKYELILRYSEDGLLMAEEYYNKDGSPGNSIEYSYEDGLLVLKTQRHPEVINPDREIFTHMPDGRIMMAEKIFSTGNYGWRFQNSYDNNGRIILTSKFDRYWKWKLVYSRMFGYNERGLLSSTEGFGMESELLWRDEYFYDDEDRLVKSVKYNPQDELVVSIFNEYDERGNYTRREFFDATDSSFAVYSYGWDYDDMGNWIAKVIGREVEGSRSAYLVPDSMISRVIEYYE